MDTNKFQLFHWTVVADMVYEATNDVCAICKRKLVERCPSYDKKGVTEKCTVVRGICKHAFHEDCLMNQMGTSIKCPIEGSEWKTEIADMRATAEKYSKKKVVKK